MHPSPSINLVRFLAIIGPSNGMVTERKSFALPTSSNLSSIDADSAPPCLDNGKASTSVRKYMKCCGAGVRTEKTARHIECLGHVRSGDKTTCANCAPVIKIAHLSSACRPSLSEASGSCC